MAEKKVHGVMRQKFRTFGKQSGRARKRVYSVAKSNGAITLISDSAPEYKFSGFQFTESVGHDFFNKKKRRSRADLGGSFFTQKRYRTFGGSKAFTSRYQQNPPSGNYTLVIYRGPIAATNPANVPFHTEAHSPDNVMDALGATAISRVAPNNPVVGLTTALAELRKGGLPTAPGAQVANGVNIARNAGSEYLNAQFGWAPLVDDIAAFGSTVGSAGAVIEQYRRNIGKPIRRTYEFPQVRETTEEILSLSASPWLNGQDASIATLGLSKKGVLIKSTSVIRRQWFSGEFTYYFPAEILGSKNLADLAILGQQLGLKPTPEVVWEIAPWSWAVDWFSNTGDVISNWTRFHQDGLVMRYGYIMEHSICTVTYSLVGCVASNGNPLPVSDVTSVIETKIRRKANPYGFGVSWEGLSPFKASILAALGISRS